MTVMITGSFLATTLSQHGILAFVSRHFFKIIISCQPVADEHLAGVTFFKTSQRKTDRIL